MFICQFVSAFLLVTPALGFLSHFDTADHLYARHANTAELESRKIYKEIVPHEASTHFDSHQHAHQFSPRWADVLPNSFKNRIAIRTLPTLPGRGYLRGRPRAPQPMRRVESDTSGIAVPAGTYEALGSNAEDGRTPRSRAGTVGRPSNGIRVIGASPRPRRSRSPPRARTGRIPGTGSASSLRGTTGSIPKSVSFKDLQEAGRGTEHAAEGGLRNVESKATISKDISKILTKTDAAMEHSGNGEVRLAGEGLAVAAAAGMGMGRLVEGAERSGKGKGLFEGLTHEAEKLKEDFHLRGQHRGHANEGEASGSGRSAYPPGLGRGAPGAPRVGFPPGAGRGAPGAPRAGSLAQSRGSASQAGRGAPAARPSPPPEPHYDSDSESDSSRSSKSSSSHSSDEEKSDLEMHQDQPTLAGKFRDAGLRPRPGHQDGSGAGGGGAGGGKSAKENLPPQSVVGAATRYGKNARPKRPPKPKKVPKKYKSTKPWNAVGLGLTAVGVAVAGGAAVAGTIAQEKGAEAAVKGADAAQLSAQAGMKGANAAQLSAEAGIEGAHASTIIAEANVKGSNASKEGADGTNLIAAVNYQTAKHQGVNVTAAKQMELEAARTNSKRKRSYPPVILYYDW